VGQAARIMKSAHENQAKVRKTYGSRAGNFGIPEHIVLDEEDAAPPGPDDGAGGNAVTVGGKTYQFPTPEAAAAFKKAAGQ